MDEKKRLQELINLQNETLRKLTQNNLRKVSSDLFGEDNEVSTPPPGFPKVPDIFGTQKEEKIEATKKKEDTPEKEPIEKLQEELHSYIGLDSIKKEVDNLINLVTVYNLRKQHELPNEDLSLHKVFTGNPGTGKTMVARLMSRIYHSLGILSKGHLVEVDRSGLVAGFVGQTAIKTSEVIGKALGGVLFIDEAYALSSRGQQDYGQEAIETLLKQMEDNRDDLVVIVAGYTELMDDFIHSNPGLSSRFNRYMEFPDYTIDELKQIFLMRAKKAGYKLSEKADALLPTLFERALKDKGEDFGNARGARNLFEQAIANQANRLSKMEEVTKDKLMTLLCQDLPYVILPEEAEDELA